MATLFTAADTAWLRSVLVAMLVCVAGLALGWGVIYRSSYYTQVGMHREQPVPFSHRHHVGGLGIDCRYCHSSVEHSASAGIPSSKTCMRCHSQIWSDSPT